MSEQQSIVAIFDILNNSAPVTPAVRKTIDNISSTYPYFIPARYIKALDNYRKDGNIGNLQNVIAGYTGNWVLFEEFLKTPPPAGGAESYSSYEPPVETPVEKPAFTGTAPKKSKPENMSLPVRKSVPDVMNPPPPPPAMPSMDVPSSAGYTHNFGDVEDAIVEEIDAPGVSTDAAEAARMQAEADALIQEFMSKGASGETVPETASVPVIEAVPEREPEHIPEPAAETPHVFTMGPAEEPVAPAETVHTPPPPVAETKNSASDDLLQPVYTDDYFMQQGERIPSNIPSNLAYTKPADESEEDKSLMVMMSFEEWLMHFRHKEEAHVEEQEDKKALKTMWQKEKLAAALEEENDEIPEGVFDLAMTSIAKEDGLASESLAEIHLKQGKYDKAIEMYQKLSLRNPEKSAYFARKIEEIKKDNII